MSSVRMCDQCGVVFSENEDNWSSVAGQRRIVDQVTGKASLENVQQDRCGDCTTIGMSPRPPIQPLQINRRYDHDVENPQ
jgi:hypothetical protein